MYLRLNELFGGFGSKNMLFRGHLLQLQPVNGSAVFDRNTRKSLQFRLGCAATVNIWKDAVEYDATHHKRASKARPRVFVNVGLLGMAVQLKKHLSLTNEWYWCLLQKNLGEGILFCSNAGCNELFLNTPPSDMRPMHPTSTYVNL